MAGGVVCYCCVVGLAVVAVLVDVAAVGGRGGAGLSVLTVLVDVAAATDANYCCCCC